MRALSVGIASMFIFVQACSNHKSPINGASDRIRYSEDDAFTLASLTDDEPPRLSWKMLRIRRSYPRAMTLDALIRKQRDVRWVDLTGARLTTDMRSDLSHLDRLKWINMPLQIEPADVKWLSRQNGVVGIGLCGSKMDKAGFSELGALSNLQWIILSELECSEASIKTWPRLPEIREVHLDRNRLAEKWLEHLCELRLSRLERMFLADTTIGDGAIRVLCDAYDPVLLDISGVRTVTDQSVEAIGREKRLQFLFVGDSGISADGVSALKSLLPDCTVYDEVLD